MGVLFLFIGYGFVVRLGTTRSQPDPGCKRVDLGTDFIYTVSLGMQPALLKMIGWTIWF